MCSTISKLVIGIIVVAVCVTALVVGIVLGTRGNDKCSSVDTPTNIKFEHNPEDDSVRVTWEYPEDGKEGDECEITYRIHYTTDGDTTGGNEDTTINLEYVIEGVTSCTVLVVQIWAISESKEESEEMLEGNYVVPATELPAPSNIKFTVVEDNLEITWEEPEELSQCPLTYKIVIETDEVPIVEETVDINSFSIPTNSFCLRVDVKITTVYETEGQTVESSYIEPWVPNLTITNVEDTNDFSVSWDAHPKQDHCSLSYRVLYRVLGVDEDGVIENDTADLTASFQVEYCEEAYVVVVAVRGDLTSEEFTQIVTYPKALDAIPRLYINENENGNGLILSWLPIEVECAIAYHIVFSTDLPPYSASYSTEESSYDIPNEIYCHEIGATVYATLNSLTSASTTINRRTYDIPPVEDLTYKLEEGIIEVSWDPHPKEQACSLSYLVTYSHDGSDVSRDTTQTTATFVASHAVCEIATISVITYYYYSPDWVSRTNTITVTPDEPSSVGEVTNINMVITDETAFISWDPPEYVSYCTEILYTVTATNSKTPTTTGDTECRTSQSCSLFLTDYCPTTIITVQASSLNGNSLTGVTATNEIGCD